MSTEATVRAQTMLDDAALARLLCEFEPGPAAMLLLSGIDPDSLDENARVDLAAAWER